MALFEPCLQELRKLACSRHQRSMGTEKSMKDSKVLLPASVFSFVGISEEKLELAGFFGWTP